MKKLIETVIILIVVVIGGIQYNGLVTLIQPVSKTANHVSISDRLRKGLEYLRCPGPKILQIADAAQNAADRTNINGMLLISLLYTESNFRYSAISPRGYVGIAQTPYASVRYPEVDILHGAMILKDKIRIANGNVYRALALYKGGDNPVAKKQANEVIQVYNRVVKYVG